MTAPARYLEDFELGKTYVLGPTEVTEADIIDFAIKFDPQIFHTDPEAAKKTSFGGLAASGWHTCALMMRQLVDEFISPVASLGSPGMDEIRWLVPVRPGDRLSSHVLVDEVRPSRSKPDRGVIHMIMEVKDQHGTVKMTGKGYGMYLRRPDAVVDAAPAVSPSADDEPGPGAAG